MKEKLKMLVVMMVLLALVFALPVLAEEQDGQEAVLLDLTKLAQAVISLAAGIVSLYLDYAELQAERKIPMSMEDWAKRLDGFLEFNGNQLLTRPGKISAEQAKLHAETEYEKYRIIQDRLYESDFDRFLLLEQEVNRNDQ